MSIIDNAQALSEWFSRVDGLIIGCGEASALVVRHIIRGEKISTDELTQVIKDAIASGQTVGYNHAQTAENVQWDLAQGGVSSHVIYSPGNKLQSIIDDALSKNEPVIIGTNYGAALADETSGLRGHFITIVGKDNSGGYITADPNTQAAVKGGFTNNSIQRLLNSNPFALIIPNQGGSGSGNTDPCGPMPLPTDSAALAQWFACKAANGSLPNPGNIFNDIGSGITSGLTNAGKGFLSALGLTNAKDLLWRTLLILLAIVLLLIGILAVSKDVIASDSDNTKVIPVPV